MQKHSFKYKKLLLILVTVGILITVSISAIMLNQKSMSSTQDVPKKQIDSPSYPTVLPDSFTIESLGGWTKISPPDAEAVYAYSDNLDSVGITVSEQPLPEAFKNNIDTQLADLAKKFNANDHLETPSATTYIGTSANGPQSVIVTKKNLLILIKSQKKIEDSSWIRYINSLN
jgi:hypothetical protein